MRRLLIGVLALVLLAAAVAAVVVLLPPPEPDPEAVADGAWKPFPPAVIAGRSGPSVVWTRKAMIVWGGEAETGVRGDGASFDLASQTWTLLPPAPIAPRYGHTAVWSGTRMVVYGGTGISSGCLQICALDDGAVYDAIADDWTPLAPSPLAARSGHRAVWLQNRMMIWGGAAEGGGTLADGASYDPATDSWALLPPSPLEGRAGHGAVATTNRMLVWGGASAPGGRGRYLADGAFYAPATNSWTPMAAAPDWLPARENFASVWTGRQMLVWGGYGRGDACAPCVHGDGGAYDPDANSWTPMAPSPLGGRAGHRAVWTGRDMLVWGGGDDTVEADGALYDPVDDAWSRVVPGTLPARQDHAMVWTGHQLLIWGGRGAGGKLGDGAVLTLSSA